MPSQVIQGIEVHWRDLREGEEILYAELPQDEQYFRRTEHPFSEDDIIAIVNKSHTYTKVQNDWVTREKKTMDYGEGRYAMIRERLTYIPASYWGYINYWTLDRGQKPDYREADRIFFLFMEYICFETDVLGITRGKGRRQGATSLGFYWMWWICGRLPEKRGGSISFNDDAAKKNFAAMFKRGFEEMLPCFVEDFDSRSETYVRFRTHEKVGVGTQQKRKGLNSYCDCLSNSINSYDSGFLSFGLFDETGKYHKMDINTYWSKVFPTLKEGTSKIGFAYMPTTVNPKDQGGETYKEFWKESNQHAINPETGKPYGLNTPNKVIRYLVPATEGYAGCIDKFGDSIIDDPIEPIMGNKGKWITEGSLSIIKKERALKKGGRLMEHRRDFPLDEFDMFSFEQGLCEFNEARLIFRINELELNPPFIRKGRLIEKKVITKSIYPDKPDKVERKIEFMEDDSGDWLIDEPPLKANDFDDFGDMISPRNMITYAAGCDTFRIGFAEDGSKGTICIFKKSAVVGGIETGCKPVAMYCGRPRLIQFLYDEIIKICMWYGCKVNIEISAGDFYYGYFHEKGCSELLYWTPARDPHNPNQKLKPGTETASPFELAAQLEAAKIFFDGDNAEVYNGHTHRVNFIDLLKQALEYNHSERTPYDLCISLMMSLLPVLKPQPFEVPKEKPLHLLPTFKIDTYI